MPIPSRLAHLPVIGIVGLAALAASAPASGDSTASSSAPDAVAAPPSASASVATPPKPPTVRGADIPTERSKAPKGKEWNDAREVSPTREGSRCKLRLLREWLRVECRDEHSGALVAGSPKDVHVWASGQLFGWNQETNEPTHASLVFELPIERGQTRILNIIGVESVGDYGGLIPTEGGTLQVFWRDGAPDPVIAFTFPYPDTR